MAVDVTAGQKPSIWNTGLIGNTALCRHDNYDGHLRAESHDFKNFGNKVPGCRDHNQRLLPTEIKYLFGASGMQNVFISKDAKYCILVIIVYFELLNQHIEADTYKYISSLSGGNLGSRKTLIFFTFTFVIILLNK